MHGTTPNSSETISLQPIMKPTPVHRRPPITELAMTYMAVEAATNRGGESAACLARGHTAVYPDHSRAGQSEGPSGHSAWRRGVVQLGCQIKLGECTKLPREVSGGRGSTSSGKLRYAKGQGDKDDIGPVIVGSVLIRARTAMLRRSKRGRHFLRARDKASPPLLRPVIGSSCIA